MGGFVLTAVYGMRSTADIDYIAVVPEQAIQDLERIAGRDSALAKKHKVWLQLVGVADYPENYDRRPTTLPLGLKELTLRTFDPYDLIFLNSLEIATRIWKLSGLWPKS